MTAPNELPNEPPDWDDIPPLADEDIPPDDGNVLWLPPIKSPSENQLEAIRRAEDKHWAEEQRRRDETGAAMMRGGAEQEPEKIPVAGVWPEEINGAAYFGVAGDVVAKRAPHTEADPVGLLMSFLTMAGNALGPGPHLAIGGDKHPARLNTVLVGDTARGRKGTATSDVKRLFRAVDPAYAKRIKGGLSTGEGLIKAVQDDSDCRLLLVEPEFARTLKVGGREGATLSAILRQAWDDGDLAVLTRGDPLEVSGKHISVLGNITREELAATLTFTDTMNGFANRFLFALVKRARKLPDGGDGDLFDLPVKAREAIARSRTIGEMHRDKAASELWAEIYNSLRDDVHGTFAYVTSRAEPQMVRLQVLYAALAGRNTITISDVKSALAVWTYCEESAAILFGNTFDDPRLNKLFGAIRAAGDKGLDGTQQRDLFDRHLKGDVLDGMRATLERQGLVTNTSVKTGGRSQVVSHCTGQWSLPSLCRKSQRKNWFAA